MVRRFSHLGKEWEARGSGIGATAGSFARAPITDWTADFIRMDDGRAFTGSLQERDPNELSIPALLEALEKALIVTALEQSPEGLSARELAEQTGLTGERAVEIARRIHRVDEDVLGGIRGIVRFTVRRRRRAA